MAPLESLEPLESGESLESWGEQDLGARHLGASKTDGMSTVSQASKWLPDLQLCILESFFLLEKAAIDIHTAAPLKLFGPFQTGDSFSTNLEASMYCLLSSASPTEVRPHNGGYLPYCARNGLMHHEQC